MKEKALAIKDETETILVPTDEKAVIEIIPFGTAEKIRLSATLVREMIAQPTRTGKLPDMKACIKFMMLCKARHLNPFEGDAYMLGYDTQAGPQFSLITAHQVFLKRAEASKGFNGMESGVIVKVAPAQRSASGEEYPQGIQEREGDLVMDGETLLGGWAKVYRKDREKPFYRRLKLSTFNTGRSRWEKDPAGMIVKCAEADALRTAFPTHLGGLYIQEETPPIDVKPVIESPKFPAAPVLAESEDTGLKPLVSGEAKGASPERESTTFDRPSVTKADSRGGGETPKKKAGSSSPTQAPSSPSTLKLKVKEKPPSIEPTKAVAPETPFQDKLNERLKILGKTWQDFLGVAYKNDWLKEGRSYADNDYRLFLQDEEWDVVMSQLEAQ